MKKRVIATCWALGLTGKRIGTHFFYSEDEVANYRYELKGFRRYLPGKVKEPSHEA